MIKLTIIIPHFNCAQRLRALLEGIPKLPEVQVIVIDDNSTGDDAQLLAQIIRDDGRCEFFVSDSDARSAGLCRNVGLRHAKGRWILFADADDILMPGFLDVLEPFWDSPADMVFFAPTSLDLATGKQSGRHVLYAGLVRDFAQGGGELNLKFRFTVLWSRLFKRELIERHGIEFESIPVAEDNMFCTRVALCASALEASESVIYCVTKDSNTLTTTVSERYFDSRVDARARRCQLLREHLTDKELRQVGMFYGDLLFMALRWFGFAKARETARFFRHHKVRLFTFSRLNLAVAWQVLKG